MLIFSVVIFVFSTLTFPRPPLHRKVGVMTLSSYGSADPVTRSYYWSETKLEDPR